MYRRISWDRTGPSTLLATGQGLTKQRQSMHVLTVQLILRTKCWKRACSCGRSSIGMAVCHACISNCCSPTSRENRSCRPGLLLLPVLLTDGALAASGTLGGGTSSGTVISGATELPNTSRPASSHSHSKVGKPPPVSCVASPINKPSHWAVADSMLILGTIENTEPALAPPNRSCETDTRPDETDGA